MVDSISTPDCTHSEVDSLVEIILLLQIGPLPPYAWRKTEQNVLSDIPKKWGQTKSLIRKVTSNRNIALAELLYFVIRKPDLFHWNKIGLLYWNIDNEPFRRERFSEVVYTMTESYRQVEKEPVQAAVKKMKGSLKDLLRKCND